MSKQFFEVFPTLQLDKRMKSLLESTTVERVTSNRAKDMLRIYLQSDHLLQKEFIWETEKQIKKLFDEAKSHKVAIIFFDEFESIGVSRDKTEELTSSIVVPELLSQMQGFETNENLLLVIAAAFFSTPNA